MIQVAHVLDNRNAGAEKNAMRRSSQIGGVVDVVRVDAHQSRSSSGERSRCVFRQERMTFKILVCLPVLSPSSVNQHGFASEFEVGKGFNIDPAPRFPLTAYHDALKIRQRIQLKLR